MSLSDYYPFYNSNYFFVIHFYSFSISNRVASVNETTSIVVTGTGFRSGPNGDHTTLRLSKCIFVDVGVHKLYIASNSMYSTNNVGTFNDAVNNNEVNTISLDQPYQMSNLNYIDSKHVSCNVPNTKGRAITLLVGVTHDYCVNSPNASDPCNQVSRLKEAVSFTYVAKTTVVAPDQGPQGSDTIIKVHGYGFIRAGKNINIASGNIFIFY